jgi:hypothetical protein
MHPENAIAKPIPGFTTYTVNPKGQVWYLGKPKAIMRKKGQSPKLRIRHNNKSYDFGLAKLIATLFIPNPENHTRVVFIDRNPNNCVASNIKWVSQLAFTRHSLHPELPLQLAPSNPKRLSAIGKQPKQVLLLNKPAKQQPLLPPALPITGFENYAITACGKVFKGNKFIQPRHQIGRGPWVALCNANGKICKRLIAHLLAAAYLPNPETLTTILHKDGDKNNYQLSNLYWANRCPQKTNSQIPADAIPVQHWPDYYITPNGIVYKGNRMLAPVRKKDKSLKIKLRLQHWPKGKYCWLGLAKLLAEHFIPNPKRYTRIIFKDRNNHNCIVSNIAWVDNETFMWYSGLTRPEMKKRKLVLERSVAIQRCKHHLLRRYYETLDHYWLNECWKEIESNITIADWQSCRSECYLYFMDRVERFSLLSNPTGIMGAYAKGVRKKIKHEISANLPKNKLLLADESLRSLTSTYGKWTTASYYD